MVLSHGIRFGQSLTGFIQNVQKMIYMSADKPGIINGKSVISFDDMLFLPWFHGWAPYRTFERVFVDEAQDLSAVRESLVLDFLAPSGRLVAVGDRRQAIFQFAGASSNVIDNLQKKLNAKILPLSVSYRLPRKVVELAKKINPLLEAAPGAIEGFIQSITLDKLSGSVSPGDCIISRTNYPLIEQAFAFIKQGRRANILGKDIGNRFKWRIECFASDDIKSLRKNINLWSDEVSAILEEKGRPTDRIEDEAASLLRFTEGATSVSEVKERINSFFSDNPDEKAISLCTAHKSKGLEWNHTFLLNDTFSKKENEENTNIRYVAITRTQNSLTFVDKK
jgi:superfamily I DNA/RNA helicase